MSWRGRKGGGEDPGVAPNRTNTPTPYTVPISPDLFVFAAKHFVAYATPSVVPFLKGPPAAVDPSEPIFAPPPPLHSLFKLNRVKEQQNGRGKGGYVAPVLFTSSAPPQFPRAIGGNVNVPAEGFGSLAERQNTLRKSRCEERGRVMAGGWRN